MTCFNPKYASYQYGRIYKTKMVEIAPEQKIKVYIKGPDGETQHKLGKKITFMPKSKYKDNSEGAMIIPCGKCLGCRLDKSKTWGLRGLLESKQWKNNCFITLTYNEEHLPKDKSLHKEDIQDFLKRLRKHYKGIQPRIWKNKIEYPIRYFYSGEYGEKGRCHFHIGIFNWKPTDMKLFKTNEYGDPIYTSEQIKKLWSINGKEIGFHTVEDMNFNTAQYIARYTAKKCFGNHDELIKRKGLKPEFIETSRKGGLAYQIKEQPEEWEKMKRNFGFWYKDKKGNLKLGKIPQFLKINGKKKTI